MFCIVIFIIIILVSFNLRFEVIRLFICWIIFEVVVLLLLYWLSVWYNDIMVEEWLCKNVGCWYEVGVILVRLSKVVIIYFEMVDIIIFVMFMCGWLKISYCFF